ncbi:hypothetical protein nbrc107696_46020 [Gordonia spumicola]|uniref:Uncharacterized protein n=1 Tax=Gordonia spumicola TaxID=589161 RepID=A0A7I9V4R2_9ACTN|nr:hypothetical protein [Gordonia spumicola]GEE00227.1 hypothetical protein nbrc107696_06730 [Gordonia spumicola]GEE04156.1 hypothetical protein nbrc107696_46020 [Gordonia spumicola]
MSDLDRIHALLGEIATETVPCDGFDVAFPALTVSGHGADVQVIYADRDEYQQQDAPELRVRHFDDTPWASIFVIGQPGESIIDVLERAVVFVRTETPVPL